MNTKIIKFDINKNLYDTLIAKQGDTKSRFLLFNLLDGSIPFSLENRSVRVYAIKPDGTEVFNDLIITDAAKGYCILELTTQMLAVAGTVKLELMVIEGEKKLTSNIFYMDVKKSINSEKAVVSTNEFGTLLTALASLDEYDNYKNEIKNARGGQVNLKTRLDNFGEQLDNNMNKTNTFINVLEFSKSGMNFSAIFQECINYCKDNKLTRIVFPNSKSFEINKTIIIPNEIEEIDFNGCTIIPSTNGTFTNNFMFSYNGNEAVTDSSSWLDYKALKLKNLILFNEHGVENIKGIFSGAKLQVENIESKYMYGTVKYSLKYIDQNFIKNVIVWNHIGDDFAIDVKSHSDIIAKGDNFNIENIEIGYLDNPNSCSNNFVRIKGGNNVTLNKVIGGTHCFEDCFVDINRTHIEWGVMKFANACFSIKNSYFQHNELEKHPYCIAILSKNGKSNPCSLENVYFSYDYWSNIKYERKINPEIVISEDFSSPIHIKNICCGSYEFNGTKHSARIGLIDNTMTITKNEIDYCNLISNDSVINSKGLISLVDNKHTIPSNDFVTVEKKKVKNSTDTIENGVVKEHFTTWKEETAKYTYHISFVNCVSQRIGIKNTQTFDVNMTKDEENSVVIKIKDSELQNVKNGYLIIVRLMNDTQWRSIITVPIKDVGCEFVDDGFFIGFTPWYGISQEDISYDWNNFYNTKIDVNGKVTTYGHDKPTHGYWNKFDEVVCTDDTKNVEKFICTESGSPGLWKSILLT